MPNSRIWQYELRRIKDGRIIFQVMRQDTLLEDLQIALDPRYRIEGKMQWYRRQAGMKRWFKVGEVIDGY